MCLCVRACVRVCVCVCVCVCTLSHPRQVQAFKAAVARGDITWHAFPFNAELELYSPVFVDEGIALTHRIDAQ